MESLTRHTDYGALGLTEQDALADPLAQFAQWLAEAEAAEIFEPNAMVLGTIDPDGSPSSRTVLLKGLDERGFVFVTGYSSRKGKALAAHPMATLLFPWYSLKRQVIVTGTVARTSESESDALWQRRPHGAQLAALASEQSQPVDSRETLDQRMAELEKRYPEGEAAVTRPEGWGGFRVTPTSIEFWQGRSKRFHDRLRYERVTDAAAAPAWHIVRLQP
jgi:pyridoxamine 5'-phosphate oxidase